MTATDGSRLGLRNALAAALAGAAACGLFWLLFPDKTLPQLTHRLLGLPGPGSGVCVAFGPFLIAACLLVFNLSGSAWSIWVTGCAFGLLHSVFTPPVFPGVKTIGSVGPLPLRIAAVVLTAGVLGLSVHALRKRSRALRYCLSAVGANLALAGFYWSAVYPLAGKGWVKPGSQVVLLGAAAVAAVALGALIPLAHARYCSGGGERDSRLSLP